MKENTKKGSCYLNGLAIFLSIIFVISIFIAADNAIPLQAATAKSQSTTVANRSKVKKDKWTTLLQKYEKSKRKYFSKFIVCPKSAKPQKTKHSTKSPVRRNCS